MDYLSKINIFDESLQEFEEIEKKAAEIENDSNLSIQLSTSFTLENEINLKSPIKKIEQLLQYVLNNDLAGNIFDNSSNAESQLKDNKQETNILDSYFYRKEENLTYLSNENSLSEKVELEKELENEIYIRKHCERHIIDLNEENLNLQKKLAVLNGIERKNNFIKKKFEISLKKVSKVILFYI
jgi:hypothetical protein